MPSNIFDPGTYEKDSPPNAGRAARKISKPDYTRSQSGLFDRLLAFFIGFVLGFVFLFVFYMIPVLAAAGGVVFGVVYIFMSEHRACQKRRSRLRAQFYDMLEALSVAIRAGNPVLKALQSAREDLLLIYDEASDIIVELDIMIALFDRGVPLSESLEDFAERSRLEDISSFASIYKTIEGKSGRAGEIVRQTQEIISDKMEIEMEIETLMTSAKTEMKIMTVMPLVILLAIAYAGAGFMDVVYTTALGRVVATVGLALFVASVIVGRKISNIRL